MNTPEETFLKDLEAYFFSEINFNEFDRKKINSLLHEYKQKTGMQVKVVNKHFVVYKTNDVYQISPNSNKKLLQYDGLKEEFDKYCLERNVKYFTKKKNGRSTKEITKLRADFCNYVAENFLVSKSELANFFGLNHATIHYYFNEKADKK